MPNVAPSARTAAPSSTSPSSNLDGTKRRVYFYGRTQIEAKRKAQAAREPPEQGPLRDATRSFSDRLAG